MPSRKPLPRLNTGGRRCAVRGCPQPAKVGSVSPYCQAHRHRLERHGDVRQETITRAHVRPWETEVQLVIRRLGKDDRAKLERAAAAIHRHLTEWLEGVEIGREDEGRSVYARKAAAHLLKTLRQRDGLSILTRAAALQLLRRDDPRRFASDAAFGCELFNLTRQLARAADGQCWDNRLGRSVARYKPISLRVRRIAAEWLLEASADFAVQLVSIYDRKRNIQQRADALIREAFAEVRQQLDREAAGAGKANHSGRSGDRTSRQSVGGSLHS